MTSKVLTKPDTQAMIKALRQAGFPVDKLDAGYECKTPSGQVIFKAGQGSNGYLVRYAKDWDFALFHPDVNLDEIATRIF